MSLRRRPHTVQVSLPDEVIRSNVLLGYGDDAQGSVQCQMTPGNATVMFDKFGVNVSRPWVLLCNADEAIKFSEGGRVTWNAREFAVVGAPEAFVGFGAADNCQVSLSEVGP